MTITIIDAIDTPRTLEPMADSLRHVDLNLLLQLDALLHERNVTRAARRLGLSQPAVSAGLARLRRHFGDELLHRRGNRYELTELAGQLAHRVPAAVEEVRRVFDATPGFDPSTSQREFTLVVSDYTATILGPPLAAAIAAEGPDVRLRLHQQSLDHVENAAQTLRSFDGLVLPHGFLVDVPSVPVYDDEWVCIVSPDAQVGSRLTMDDLHRLRWAVTYHRPTAYTPAVQQLRALGVEPRLELVTESFLALPFVVAGTDRIALIQRRLATLLADAAGVRVLECPWDVVPLKQSLWWHPIYRADPGHRWLRGLVAQVGERINAAEIRWLARGSDA